jgi:carbon monoxide dehydrogenase subunit G
MRTQVEAPMATVTVTHTYTASKKAVFDVLADIGNVKDISPGIESSKRINETKGKGGARECDFGKGAGIHEEVTAFTDGKQIQFTGIKFWGSPMKEMVATFDFRKEGKQTIVDCGMDYDMKFGFIMNPMAKGQMRKAMAAMLAGVETKL